LKAVPGVSGQIDKEREKMVAKLAHGLAIEGDNHKFTEIPDAGVAEAELLEVLRAFVQKERVGWSSGKVSGKVYNGTDEVTKLINTVYGLYSVSNSLHPDVFPSVRKFEAEIIRMTATMLHGDSSVVGATTAGGTESILMAVKTYREAGRARGIEVPEMFVQHSNNNVIFLC
jgi:glutamate/tyrosine decarboxylase-like PLP-dependent enzyme